MSKASGQRAMSCRLFDCSNLNTGRHGLSKMGSIRPCRSFQAGLALRSPSTLPVCLRLDGPSRRCNRHRLKRHSDRVVPASSGDPDSSVSTSAFDIVFGKPSAPRELWERIAKEARAGLMAQVELGDERMDVLLAALHLAAEDDAVKTRTHIPLPVESYSSRLDAMAAECSTLLPPGLDAQGQLDHVLQYVYDRWGLTIAKGMSQGEYSPYRVYINNVLTQKCGTPSSSAALLSSLLLRLRHSGAMPALQQHPPVVGIALSSTRPVAALPPQPSPSSSESATGAAAAAQLPDSPLVRWVTSRELLAEMLDQLKRFYWSWDWPLGAASGFDACARSLLGESGRAGLVSSAVGVMQPTGRPFGNVELSVLATERAALVTRCIDSDGWEHAVQVRDLGALYLHVGKHAEGLALLESYLAWVQGEGQLWGTLGSAASPSPSLAEAGGGQGGGLAGAATSERAKAPGAYGALVAELVLRQRRRALESAFGLDGGGGSGPKSGPGGFKGVGDDVREW